MRIQLLPAALWMAVLAPVLLAQDDTASVGGPVLGYVFDSRAQSLKPLLGIPGSSLIGPAWDAGMPFRSAAVSPQQNYVLAVAAGDGRVYLVRTGRGAPSATLLDGAAPAPERIAISPMGQAAVLLNETAGRLEIWTGLPAAPSLAAAIDTAGRRFGPVAAADEGFVLAGVPGETGDSIFLFGTAGEARSIASAGTVSALAFLNSSRDALMADAARRELAVLADVSGAAQYRVIASLEQWKDPAALAASDDNRRAFLADAQTGMVAAFDIEAGGSSLLTCRCKPEGLFRLNADNVFRLNQPAAAPLWMLNAAGHESQLLFIPPDVDLGGVR